jgi:ATP-dependent DNA helicase RecG
MELIELAQILSAGEDSKHQFKKTIENAEQLSAEMIALSNGAGGSIFIGVDDDGIITGLDGDNVRQINQYVSNAASQHVRPAINPTTENIITDKGIVLVVSIPAGINKPYQDKNGVFWVKNGADKRKATSREELQRLFQTSDLIHADEARVPSMMLSDLDIEYFKSFFQKRYGKSIEKTNLPLPQLLHNLNLLNHDCLNVTGALLFGKNTSSFLPSFIVKAGAFDDIKISTNRYNDLREITGRLDDIFQQTIDFILANLHHVQGNQGFNSVGIPEIPRIAIEELVVNALVHRNYFISAPIRVFVFIDRVEIISPGHLPNNLLIENIKAGNSNSRNSVLASFAYHLLPYNGIGSGILRATEAYPAIDFLDDREGNTFKVIIHRPPQK